MIEATLLSENELIKKCLTLGYCYDDADNLTPPQNNEDPYWCILSSMIKYTGTTITGKIEARFEPRAEYFAQSDSNGYWEFWMFTEESQKRLKLIKKLDRI